MSAELEQQVASLTQAVAARDALLEQAAARIAELEQAVKSQAMKLRAANQDKRAVELHAAAVIASAGGEVEIDKETLRNLNPDTKVELHVHTDDCECNEVDGARVTAEVTPYR